MSMIAELENLVTLQKRDLEIAAIESRLKKIPVEIAELEQKVAIERANAKAAEERLTESQKSRRRFEGELELIEGRIEKYKDQLMQVKSNEEYRAMQKQIQSAKEDVSAHEDMILAKMEEADRLCNRIAIMDAGRIIAMDTPHNLKARIGDPDKVTLEDVFLNLTGRSLRD